MPFNKKNHLETSQKPSNQKIQNKEERKKAEFKRYNITEENQYAFSNYINKLINKARLDKNTELEKKFEKLSYYFQKYVKVIEEEAEVEYQYLKNPMLTNTFRNGGGAYSNVELNVFNNHIQKLRTIVKYNNIRDEIGKIIANKPGSDYIDLTYLITKDGLVLTNESNC